MLDRHVASTALLDAKPRVSDTFRRDSYDAAIRWTSYGIPHIKAGDYDSLAFGVGYAYARDNAELLADAVLTVRGVRSLCFGVETLVSHQSMSNLDSDFFHKIYFDPVKLDAAYTSEQPRTAAMLEAYAAGVRRSIAEAHAHGIVHPCLDALKDAPITRQDLYLLLAQKAAQTSGCAFASAILAARPPSSKGEVKTINPDTRSERTERLGSNAFAIGRDLSETGTGLLVANPHFPWFGPHRFYQMHLTIPGELDVMGASVPPFPVINIGFNRNIAWTHTVSPSRRYAIYELRLGRASPLTYRIGSQTEPMIERAISVPVRSQDGRTEEMHRIFYSTRHGPIIALPEAGCLWSDRRAYAFCDSAQSIGMVEQWLALNKASSVKEVDGALSRHRGALWLNTLAADRKGDVYFGDLTAVPNVSAWQQIICAPSRAARRVARQQNVIILNGARRVHTPRETSQGVRPAANMPRAIRSDYVLNCNDSHWLIHRTARLRRYPRFVGLEHAPQGFRTRMAHHELSALTTGGRRIASRDCKEMLFSNRNYAALQVRDDLCKLSLDHSEVILSDGHAVELAHAFAVLQTWSGCDDSDAAGAVLFREFWRRVQSDQKIWRIAFNSKEPLTTPRGLAIHDPAAIRLILTALGDAIQTMLANGFPIDVTLSAVQGIRIADQSISLHGGDGSAGVLNLMEFGKLTKDGYPRSDIQGTSYSQIVTWVDGAVVADAILPFSQSSNEQSPNASDQTRLFSQKAWVRLPFAEADVISDPNLTQLRIHETALPQ
ncbi:MAG: aculeacin A acylase [Nitrobacter sp.]|uniref:penicillin acylase family protein n=1 Tax=Nitrobacter sp. TaxID=29420 RepID=UPI00387DE114